MKAAWQAQTRRQRQIWPTRYSGRLLIATSILKPANEPADRGSFMDIYMMLYGGHERTAAEFQTLLGNAGFSILRTIPTPALSFIIECEPIGDA
jgi:hypothetical protein